MSKAPKLRFKEFSGDWEKKRLSEIASIKGGYAFKSKEFSNYKDNYQVIKMGNLYQNQLLLDRSPSYKKEISEKEKEYLLKSGDIIITLTGTVGKKDFGYSYMISDEKNLLLNQRLGLIRNKENISDNRFLKYIVLDKFFLDQFFESSVGGTGNQANVSTKNMEEFYVYMPKLEEQEKIASFFSLIDDKISLQGEKLDMLKDYKRGMMQKIFSRELRFKDDEGRNYPEWEEKKLGDIANLTSSKRVFASDYVDEGIPFYRGKEITELKQNKKPNDILYITQEKYNDIKNNFGIPVKGDLLLTAVGTLGNSYVIKDDNPFYFKDGNLIWFKDIKEDVNFLNFILTSEKGQKKIIDSAIGSTQKALTIVELNKLKYEFPSLDEQRKIAKFLNNLEIKVMKEQEKLDSLNEYKKGLLQQMFV